MTFDPLEDEEAQGRWTRHRDEEPPSKGGKILLIVMVVLLLAGVGVIVFAGRSIAFAVVKRQTAKRFPELHWVDGAALAQWRVDSSRPPPVILDARTETEYAVSHLADAARIDPYRPLLRPLRNQPTTVPIVVYSSVGYRSARVAEWLRGQGYTDVQNLEGGIFRWVNDGRPIFRQGGQTEQVHPYQPRWGLLLESGHRIAAPALEKRSAAP